MLLKTISAAIIMTLTLSTPTMAAKVSLDQCAKWYKQVKKYQSTNKQLAREISSKMRKANCPARHNKYYE